MEEVMKNYLFDLFMRCFFNNNRKRYTIKRLKMCKENNRNAFIFEYTDNGVLEESYIAVYYTDISGLKDSVLAFRESEFSENEQEVVELFYKFYGGKYLRNYKTGALEKIPNDELELEFLRLIDD
jgi:hypothetical protein